MARFGFTGGFYTLQSVNADAQRSVNLCPQIVESDAGKSRMILIQRPGLVVGWTLAGETQVPRVFSFNDRVFAAGLNLWELFTNGTAVNLGVLTDTVGPIYFAANLNQLLISTSGKLYVFNFSGGLIPVDMTQFIGPVGIIGYKDGFFLAQIPGTNVVYLSNLLDGLDWSGLDAIQVSVFADNVVSMIVDHNELVLLGKTQSITYYNNGDLNNPFVPNLSAGTIEQGSSIPAATIKIDNTLYMVGGDDRGELIAYKANGYTPQRISTHAIEAVWQRYQITSDAVAFAMQYQGHHWWVITFPSAEATWVYDVTTQLWHEWACTDAHGKQIAFLGQGHAFGFKAHLVGGTRSGVVYKMLESAYDDAGAPMVRTRCSPHISVELEKIPHEIMQVDIETGLGPMITLQDGSGQVREPQVSLCWSDDGGHFFKNERFRGIGSQGEFRKRVIWRQLGAPRDRVYKLTCSDPVPLRIIDAHLTAGAAYQPTERQSALIGKSA